MDDAAGQKPFMKLKISSAKPTGEAASAPQGEASAPAPATPERGKTASPFMTPPAALSPSASTTGPVLRTFKPAAPGTASPATSGEESSSLPPVPGPSSEVPSAADGPSPAAKTYEEGPSKKLKLQKLPPPGTVVPTPVAAAPTAKSSSTGAPKVSALPAPVASAPAQMSAPAAKPVSEAKKSEAKNPEDSGAATSTPAGVQDSAAASVSTPVSTPSTPADSAPVASGAPASAPAQKAEARPATAKAPVAAPSRPVVPVVLIGAGIGALLILCFLAFRMATSTAPAAAPAPEVESGRAATPAASPVSIDKPAADVAPGVTEAPKTVPDTAPADGAEGAEMARTRDAELSLWLDSARVTSVSSDRITLNRRVYALGAAVNAEGTLKWVGRDTVKGSLLFMDKAGVVYEKPVR